MSGAISFREVIQANAATVNTEFKRNVGRLKEFSIQWKELSPVDLKAYTFAVRFFFTTVNEQELSDQFALLAIKGALKDARFQPVKEGFDNFCKEIHPKINKIYRSEGSKKVWERIDSIKAQAKTP